jgi:hypothetical protein
LALFPRFKQEFPTAFLNLRASCLMKVRLGWLNNPYVHLALVAAALAAWPSQAEPLLSALFRAAPAAKPSPALEGQCPPGCIVCASSSPARRAARDRALIRMGVMDRP